MIIGIKKHIVQAVVLCVIMLLGTYSGYAQIRKTFTPRTSTLAPGEYRGVTNYNLQGDFKMIGNTNMTTVSRSGVEEVNGIVMRYVDIDNDANTINSSSSTLALDNPDCAEIIYAGLYWTGRSHDIDNVSTSPNTFSVQRYANAQWYSVGHNGNLGSGTLMTISPQASGSIMYPRYTFYLGGGTTVDFEFTNSNGNDRVRYRTNNGSWTSIGNLGYFSNLGTNGGTVSGNQLLFSLYTPVVVGNVEFHQLVRYSPTNGSVDDYQSITHNAAKVRVRSGATTSKSLNKQQIKLKMGASNSYTTITANSTDIHYPTTVDKAMYAAYADVTNYVRTNGAGEYFVADMALQEGSGGPTGYYGGWGMVIVYKDVSKRWRDITVFDGFGYITSNGSTVNLDVSGFRAVQNGAVNVTLGMMAGEGDREISGDFFLIRNSASSSYTTLSHSGNSTDDFFNSSVVTGGNPRNPNYVNNTGLDIARFDLTNNGNSIINNNQTSTRFQFGTSGDAYSIFNIVFAVDAYVPEVIGENGPAAGSSVPHQGMVDPGQELEFQLDLFNKGTEAVNGLTVDIPIPFNMHYVENGETIIPGSHSTIKIANNTTVQWIPPTHAPSGASPDDYAGGILRWNVGALPLDPNRNVLQGTLKYKFRVTDNCALLTTAGPCALNVNINGTISGVGATSNTILPPTRLVRDYGSGACAGPIYDDFELTINISDDFKTNCSPPPVENGMLQFVAFCSKLNSVFTRAEIADHYPKGTKFFTQEPVDYNSTTGLIAGDFPVTLDGSKTTYWAVAPGMDPGCFIRLQTSLTLVTTTPTAQNVTFCKGDIVTLNVTRSATGIVNDYELFYYTSSDATTPMATAPNPATIGTHTYWVAEGVNQNGIICTGNKIQFTITIYEQPTVAQNVADVSICENSDTQFTVTTSGATSYAWEYTTAAAPTVWLTLDNSTFSGQISLTNNSMNVSHAIRVGTNSIDGIKVRLKAINDNGCEAYSNEIAIEVKDCRAITNPMLPSKANK